MVGRWVAVCLGVAACGGHAPVAADAFGTGIDGPPVACPTPFTEDSADHSVTPQVIAAPGKSSGTAILVLGMPDAGGYASLHGYFTITGLPATKPMNIALVMGDTCTPGCSKSVEMRAGYHPNIVLLGDDLNAGCSPAGSTPTSFQGELQLLALDTNNGANYGYLVQIP